MDTKIVDEIRALMRKADRKMEAARKNMESGFFDDVISRAYYACYHAGQAMLLTQDLRARSHRGLKNLFGLHLVQTKKIERDYAVLLDDLRNARENGDYEIFLELTEKEAQEALVSADRFLDRTRSFLKEANVSV